MVRVWETGPVWRKPVEGVRIPTLTWDDEGKWVWEWTMNEEEERGWSDEDGGRDGRKAKGTKRKKNNNKNKYNGARRHRMLKRKASKKLRSMTCNVKRKIYLTQFPLNSLSLRHS